MLEEEPLPSVVLVDLLLPDANGVLPLRRIKRDQLHVRVGVVTGVRDLYAYFDIIRYPLSAGLATELRASKYTSMT